MVKTLKREEIPDKYKWKLEHIFASEEEWEAALKKSEEMLKELDKKKDTALNSAANLLSFLREYNEYDLLSGKLGYYAHLKADENTKDSKRQALSQKLTPLSLLDSSIYSSFKTAVMEKGTLDEFYNEEKELLFYKKFFDKLFRLKPHVLTKDQEYIISQTSLLNSSSSIYKVLNNADLSFPTIKDEKGNDVKLTQGNYIQFLESKDRNVRESAFKALYSTFKQFENTIAATLYASNKKDVFYSKIKNYPSTLKMSLFVDDVSPDVYNNLLNTVENNIKPMEKYLELRKKVLGLDELHMYDLFTPLVKDLDVKITFEEAFKTVKEALSVFGDDYVSRLEEAHTGGWIDVYENEGKRGGAYKSGPYGVHPYVLLNHKDNINSMFTLAHELGHALHSNYSNENNDMLYAQYVIFTAEVASTVNEVLLMRHLLKNTEDKKMKMYLLTHFADKYRTTVYRQTMFASFEKITHERVEKGEPLTAEILSDIYYNLNKTYYGEGVFIDEEIATEWARIPHFYTPFYVYKYATGFSAAIALSKQILEEGEPAVERYINFLKSGGTDFPVELLKKAGVDMSTPQPIEDALKVFEELVDELESLI